MADREEIFREFTDEMHAMAGAALRSVLVHGSAITEDFRPGLSDYNFVVLADPCDPGLLRRMAERAGRWRKRRISAPLVFTPEFVDRARDSYPLEFLSMKAGYRVLAGEDFLSDLPLNREDVRLQTERDLWARLLHFRRAYIEYQGAPRHLQGTLAHSFSALVAVFRGLLFLREAAWQATGPALADAVSTHLGVAPDLFAVLQDLRFRKSTASREQITGTFEAVLDELRRLALEVDRW